MLRVRFRRANLARMRADGRRYDIALRRANQRAVNKATETAQKRVRGAIRAAGLGKLDRVVGMTSSLKKGERDARNAWGAIYAKGKMDRGAGALESYSRGMTIRPRADLFQTGWLWIPQRTIPRTIRRFRTTPALYNRSSYATTIGPLVFRQIASNRALLVIKRVTVSVKNGRARRAGKRALKQGTAREIVAFVGIRQTRRSKRFDKDQIVRLASQMVPDLTARELELILSQGGALG